MLSKTSRSTSPVGSGLGLRAGDTARPPKSRGIGGRTLVVEGECDREGGVTSISIEGEGATPLVCGSGVAGACWEETLKKEDEPLWVVVRVVPPDGRPGFSRPLPLSVEGSRSLPFSRFIPNDSFEAFFMIDGRWTGVVRPVSPDPVDVNCWWLLPRRVGVSTEDISIDGRWMHSNPPLVSRYCTCIRSRTRRISALMTGGDLVEVVATLYTETSTSVKERKFILV
jgi:hypothetical protein